MSRSAVGWIGSVVLILLSAGSFAASPVASPASSTFTTVEDTAPFTGNLSGVFTDADLPADTLTYGFGSTSGDTVLNAAVDPLTGVVTFTSILNQNGTQSWVFTATDSTGNVGEFAFTATVTPVNDAPVVSAPIPDLNALEDGTLPSFNLDVVFLDVDIATNGDALTYSVFSNSNPALFDSVAIAGSTLSMSLAPNQNGTATIIVEAVDSAGSSVLDTFVVNVSAVDDTPVVLVPELIVTVSEDTPSSSTSLLSVFDDPDIATNGDSLTLSVESSPGDPVDAASIVGSNLVISYVPELNGTETVDVRATDAAGNWAQITVGIIVNPVNDAPVIVGAVADEVVDEDSAGSAVGFGGVFDDVDIDTNADSLTLSVWAVSHSAIASASMSGDTLNIAYLPDQNGTGTITVRATDSAGAWVDYELAVTVNPVNDDPVLVASIPDINTFEDAVIAPINLYDYISDVDFDTNGEALKFTIASNSNPSLFSTASIAEGVLTLTLAPDQNGFANITVEAVDAAGVLVTDTFRVNVASINDVPLPEDDAATMSEDQAFITIAVMDNDYLAEEPTFILSAGAGGFSESPPTTIVDAFGDGVAAPNGTVLIDATGTAIEYQPKPDFYGTDYFTYVLQDSEGDVSPPATVTVTVLPVNDLPIGVQELTYSMFENGTLTVPATDGVLIGAYDVDGKLLDDTGNEIGSPLSAVLTVLPSFGALSFDGATGSFIYTPPINFTGIDTFGYRLFDDEGVSAPPDYVVRIVVNAAPPPAEPPNPGEVAINYNLASVPLDQTASVPPNVLVVMDDSGSMDWNMSVAGADENGGFVLDNASRARRASAESFVYLWDLRTNTYPPGSQFGRVLPTQQALEDNGDTRGNDYGAWRARTYLHNKMYYNPTVNYVPWTGQDITNAEFENAVPSAIRLDPVDPTRTFDILAPHSYLAQGVPMWNPQGGTTDVAVVNLYVPRYYTTAATPPLAESAAATLVEIRPDGGPSGDGVFPGGPGREDCAADDDNPLDCTYEQEIQNFANWFQYFRSREYVIKSVLGRVFADVQDIRVGYETISATTSIPVADMNDLYTEGNKKALIDNVYKVDSFGGTPLRQALGRAGKIFACETGNYCPALPPPDGTCQQNFALLFSDGYWNGGAGVSSNDDEDGSGPFDGGVYADGQRATLADTAMHYYENDMFPEVNDEVPISPLDVLGAPEGTFAGETMHQHMKTYAIAFGVKGTVDPSSIPANPATPFGWPDPFAGPLEKIDDMLHAAKNGRGEFLSAGDPQELQAAFEKAFLAFTQAASSASAAAFNSTSLRDGTFLFRGFYDLRDNTGELTATVVNADGTLADTPTWRASEMLNPGNKLPTNRVLVTSDSATGNGIPFRHGSLAPEQQIMMSLDQTNYLRGERSAELPLGYLRERPPADGLLGDIVNASPVFIGEPRAINRDQEPYPTGSLYSSFAEARATRTPIVYVGANDGMLHGFEAQTGIERFGFIPNKLIDSSQRYRNALDDLTSPFYLHKYYVDLTPRFNDAYVKASRGALGKSWNTILLGGLGGGGKGYFALNVTDPDTMFASEAAAANSVLWEFTDEDDTYPVDDAGVPLGGAVGAITDPYGQPVKDLGVALSLPNVVMSNVSDGGTPAEKEWVAIFGNGPNSTAGIAKLFVLFMDRGLDGWGEDGDFVKINTGFGVPIAPAQKAGFPNGLGDPTSVDIDLNGTVDWVYAGDRLGNLFRFDLTDPNPDNWTSTRLFSATYFDGVVDRVQPITARPLVVKHPTQPGFLVIFGTGSYVTRDDARNEEIQSIYAIWDRGEVNPPTAQPDSKSLRFVEQTITNVVDDTVTPAVTRRVMSRNLVDYVAEGAEPGTYGWYIDFDMVRAAETLSGGQNPDIGGYAPPDVQYPGEKAVRRMIFRDGTVITTTILPATGETSCFGARPGSILLFDVATGGDPADQLVDFNNDGVINDGDMVAVGGSDYAAGLLFNAGDLDGTLVDLSTLGGEGDQDFLFVSGGSDTSSFRISDINDSSTGRLSWREIDDVN